MYYLYICICINFVIIKIYKALFILAEEQKLAMLRKC